MTRLLLLLAVLTLAAAPACAGDPDDGLSLRARIEAARAPSGHGFHSRSLYPIIHDLLRGALDMDDDDVDATLDFLVEVIEDCGRDTPPYSAFDLMPRFAHPRLADALESYLGDHPDDPCRLRRTADTVLARLGDARVLPRLLEDLHGDDSERGRRAAVLLAELGDRRGLAELDALLEDPHLARRLGDGLIRRRTEAGNDTDPDTSDRYGVQEARLLRAAVRDARGRLYSRLEHDLRLPYALPPAALERLGETGVVVLPRLHNEMHELVDEQFPFITTDFVYHTAMILVRAAMDDLESHWLDERTGALCRDLCVASLEQAAARPGRDDRRAAELNAAFFAVAAVLSDAEGIDTLGLPRGAGDALVAELARIGAATGRYESDVLGREEDYSEYRPRGRAGRGDARADAAFQARVWLGHAVFPADDAFATRRALLIVAALDDDPALDDGLRALESVYDLLGGARDDPSIDAYRHLCAGDPLSVLDDAGRFAAFREAVSALPPPRIHTGTGADRAGALGLRLLGQRRSPDGELFQSLMESGVWPPSGLHVAARLLGSPAAAERLHVAPASLAERPGPGLVDGLLHCYTPLFEDGDDLPPPFRSAAWQDKQLNNALGAWAETRHAAGPYVKAAHQYLGCSTLTARVHGFVEPYPEFFRRLHERMSGLHALLDTIGFYDRVDALREEAVAAYASCDQERRPTPEGLDRRQRHAFQQAENERRRRIEALRLEGRRLDRTRLPEFLVILERLERLAGVCRRGLGQTAADGLFLKGLGDRMRRLGFNESSMNVAEVSMASCIDVAVEYLSGECLEAAIGPARPIYVAVPAPGGRIVCRGAVYGYVEFLRPVDERLTDRLWKQLADLPDAPGLEPWLEDATRLFVRPTIERDSLLALAERTSERPRNDVDSRRPWRPVVRHAAAEESWVDGRVSAADVDLLLELAADRALDGSLQVFVQRNLLAHASAPGVAEAAHAELQRLLEESGERRPMRFDRYETLRLVYGSAILAEAGDRRHAFVLERLRGALGEDERYPGQGELLDEALRRIRRRAPAG